MERKPAFVNTRTFFLAVWRGLPASIPLVAVRGRDGDEERGRGGERSDLHYRPAGWADGLGGGEGYPPAHFGGPDPADAAATG